MDIQKYSSDFSAESLRKGYINNILERNPYIHNFISMLLNIEKGGVIAIDGEWGSGKTYFVHQVKWLLDCTSKNIDGEVESVLSRIVPKLDNIKSHKYKAFYYDAWKYDKSNNPFFTLLRTMILAFGGIDYFNQKKGFIESLLKSASHIVKGITPIDVESIFNGIKEFSGINDTTPLSELEFIEQMDSQVNSFLDYICEGQYDKLVVFIDELDRCRPSFAVELLEIIKHYFNNDKLIFVLSTNLKEFQYCIKHYYGEGFDGWKYLDRFIDIRITLPKITVEELSLIHILIEKVYINRQNIPTSSISFNNGTVLYSKLRPYLNKVVIADENGYGTSELIPLNSYKNGLTAEYLAYYLRQDSFVEYIKEMCIRDRVLYTNHMNWDHSLMGIHMLNSHQKPLNTLTV